MKFTKIINTLCSLLLATGLSLAVSNFTSGVLSTASEGTCLASLVGPDDNIQDGMTSNFRTAVIGIINYALTFLGLAAVGFIIYAGVKLVISGGDEEALTSAKTTIIYAGVGIIIIMLAWTIVNVFVGVGDAVQ